MRSGTARLHTLYVVHHAAHPRGTLGGRPRRQADGTLLIAGHGNATIPRIVECFRRVVCNDPTSNVARLDPGTLRADHFIRYPYNPQFWGSSTAVQVGREIWMGAPAGKDRAVPATVDASSGRIAPQSPDWPVPAISPVSG